MQQRQQSQQLGAAAAVTSAPSPGPALSPPQDVLAAPSPGGAESGSTAVAAPEALTEPLTPSQARLRFLPSGLCVHREHSIMSQRCVNGTSCSMRHATYAASLRRG